MTQHNLYKNLLCKNELWLQCRASKLGAMEMRGNTIQDTNQSLVASTSLYNIDDHFSFLHNFLNMKIMVASLLKMLHLLGEQKKKNFIVFKNLQKHKMWKPIVMIWVFFKKQNKRKDIFWLHFFGQRKMKLTVKIR